MEFPFFSFGFFSRSFHKNILSLSYFSIYFYLLIYIYYIFHKYYIYIFFFITIYLCPVGYFFAIFRAVGIAGPQLPTSELARLNLNRKVLNTVGTTGPQPGTFRLQWTPLDLNLGPSELSGHRWTSTWDKIPEYMSEKLPKYISDK